MADASPVNSRPHASTLISFGEDSAQNVGALAEALVFYDCVVVKLSNDEQFLSVVRFFDESGDLAGLFSLLRERQLVFLNYEYLTGVMSSGRWIQGIRLISTSTTKGKPISWKFIPRILEAESVLKHFNGRERVLSELQATAADASMDEPVGLLGPQVRNTEEDFFSSRRCTLCVQNYLRHDARFSAVPEIERVEAMVRQNISRDGELLHDVEWVVPDPLSAKLRERGIVLPKPINMLEELARVAQFVGSTSRLRTDIWPSGGHALTVADKVYEVSRYATRVPEVVDDLVGEIEFPDISALVTVKKLQARDILEIRAKSEMFRRWLQVEGERDRNALHFYTQEMSKESGLSGVVRKTLKLAGVLVPPAAGIALASTASPTMGVTAAIAAKAATEGTKYLLNAAASFDAGWKPQMFGNWLKKRIDRIMKEQSC